MIVYINGNDNRCKQLAKLMIADGYQIQEDSRLISSCDIIYLGKDGQGFEQVDFKNNAVVLSLLKNQRLCYLSKLKGFNYRYLYSDEDFVVENTHISDEAVIAYMIIDNSISLSNSNVLILGYGHCGRDLAAKLEKFNAKVSISNRSDHYHDEVVEKGYQYYDWNGDSTDASGNHVAVDKLIRNGTSCHDNNVMILCHDTQAKDTTVQALPAIIEHYKNLGYTFKGIDDATYAPHQSVNN